MKTLNQTAYLAPPGLEHLLLKELKNITNRLGRLILAEGPPQPVLWVRNIWFESILIPFHSISHAAQTLRSIQRNWCSYSYQFHRRTHLIQEKLPFVSAKPLTFLAKVPTAPLGSWMLLDEQTILASAHCLSPMPHGEWAFVEDKLNPPSRAYLKLWEFFTRFRVYPDKTQTCLDLGASPGGWTFVLSHLAKKVYAYDRSPLDERLMTQNNISFTAGDAFKVNLAAFEDVSFIFSDVVCFPEKLYTFICSLVEKFPDKNYVVTIKFSGNDNQEIIDQFKKLPGNLIHLSHNKHELTWFKI